MKKSIVFAVLASVLLYSTTACSQMKVIKGSDKYITRKASVDSFHGIKVTGSPDVIYTQTTGQPSIEIYGQDNIVPLVEAIIEKGTLVIKFKNNTNITNVRNLEVKVNGPALEKISVAGSGGVFFPKGLETDNKLSLKVAGSGDIQGDKVVCSSLEMSVAGSGDIKLTGVDCPAVRGSVAGSGDIYVSGSGENASFSVAGSGDVHAQGFEAENVEARVSGSGDIRCFATQKLSGGVSGSGDVRYKGNPEISFSKKGLRRL